MTRRTSAAAAVAARAAQPLVADSHHVLVMPPVRRKLVGIVHGRTKGGVEAIPFVQPPAQRRPILRG